MVGEPFLTTIRNMDDNLNTNLEGKFMTTLAGSGNMTKGCDMEVKDGRRGGWYKRVVDADGVETSVRLPGGRLVLFSSSSSLASSSSSLSAASSDRDLRMASSSEEKGKGVKGGKIRKGKGSRKDGMVGRNNNNEDNNRKRKEMRKEMGKKDTERKEMERKEDERKESEKMKMERKEKERKETERKEIERKEMERKELERKETERKEFERKEFERLELERKETERKEMERKEKVRKETERKKMLERKELERKELERKENERMEFERMEMERKEKERKETEGKDMEGREMEGKETEGKETNKYVAMIKEGTAELVNRLYESERENLGLKEEIKRLKSSLYLCMEGLSKADAAVKVAHSTVMGLLASEGGVLPPLIREEFFSLPPLSQRIDRISIASGGGDRISPVVQSPPPMVNRGFEDVETSGETYKSRGSIVPCVGLSPPSKAQVAPLLKEHPKEEVTSSAMSGLESGWKLVGGGRRGRKFSSSPPSPDSGMEISSAANNCVERRSPFGQQLKSGTPKPPLCSAVAIVGCTDGFSYAAALKSAREHIDLEALGIKNTNIRKAANGGLLIEVLEEDSRVKAEELGTRIREVLKDSAKVSCPSGRKREVRVTGFDVSVSGMEIVRALSNCGGCPLTDVKVGPIRTLDNGLGIARVQLPAVAAAKLMDTEGIRLGWMMARVELLKTRPLQCYRCWKYGHTQNLCRGTVDRRDACFKCGQVGHMVNKCQNVAHCVVCLDKGLEASHRFGGPQCVTNVQQGTLLGSCRPIRTD